MSLLLSLALLYGVSLDVNRDSGDHIVKASFRKLAKKVHPDKGGNAEDAKRLFNAKEAWEAAKSSKNVGGRPPSKDKQGPDLDEGTCELADPEEFRKARRNDFRIQGQATMLTYNGVRNHAQWKRLVSYIQKNFKKWGLKHWCATLESCPHSKKLHIHVFLQFTKAVDVTTKRFEFEGLRPHADPHDYLGEGQNRKRAQDSINRGFFYVWADKVGTERDATGEPCVTGNFMPCWTDCPFKYAVRARWAESLWKARKLTHDVYEDYLYKSRDGVLPRKRNLDAVKENEKKRKKDEEVSERVKRIRGNPKFFKPFPEVPEARRWLQHFKQDGVRFPILVVHGPSLSGKTEFAKSLFKNPLQVNIGNLDHFPDAMRKFDRDVHDAIILDDVRDCRFLVIHQDKLQGTYDRSVEFASTQGGQCAYDHDLYAIPIVATINNSTSNLCLLEKDDWLGNPGNRVWVSFPPV